MNRRPIDLARVLIGRVTERPGGEDHPYILWCLELVGIPSPHDEIPWCSALVNENCFRMDLPRTGSARARSWLAIGTRVPLSDARPGFDVVVLSRGDGAQPGVDVIDAPGHVTWFDGLDGDRVWGVGGNQRNAVTRSSFARSSVLAIQRLFTEIV